MGFSFRAGSRALALFRSALGRGRGAGGGALTSAERDMLLHALRLGCPQTTAAKCVGRTVEALEAVLAVDDELQRAVLRAEAQAEVRHMSNVHKASESEKNWRSSVWWLEQRAGGGETGSGATIPEAVLPALEAFAEAIIEEIPDVLRRQSLLTKLLHIAVDSVAPPPTIDAEATNVISAPGEGEPAAELDEPRRKDASS